MVQAVLALLLAGVLSFLFLHSQVDHARLGAMSARIQLLQRDESVLRRLVEQAYRGGVLNYDALSLLSVRMQQRYETLSRELAESDMLPLERQARALARHFSGQQEALHKFKRALVLSRIVDLYLPGIGEELRRRLRALEADGQAIGSLRDELAEIQIRLGRLEQRIGLHPQAAQQLVDRLATLPRRVASLDLDVRKRINDFVRHASMRARAVIRASSLLGKLSSDHRQDGLDRLAAGFARQVARQEREAGRYRVALFAVAGLLLSYLAWVFINLQRVSERLSRSVQDLDFHKFVTDEHAITSITDAAGRITYVNDHFCQLTGHSRRDLLGKTHRVLKSGLHDEAFYHEMWETISSGQVWRGTICNRSRDGSLKWFETTIVPRLDDQGRPYEYFAIRTDVSDKVSAERQVAWLARIPEENPEPVMRLDRGGRVLYANEAATALLKELQDASRRWLHATWPQGVLLALESGVTQELELLVAERYYHFYLVPVVSEDYVNIYAHDVTERHKAELQLSFQARHDALTGLANRRAFEGMLDQAIEEARSEDQHSMLLYLDLDQFKVVNDTCGHVAGDELLRQLGRELSQSIRSNDDIARLGGDEFAVLLRNCPREVGLEIAEKLRRQVTEFQFLWEDKSFRLGVSIGVVEIRADSQGRDDVLAAADVACYAAKDSGRNRVHLYRLDDDHAAQRRDEMHWAGRIPQALADDRFALMVQAVVPLHAEVGEQGHYEVLVRMLRDDGTMIPPGAFIPAAERYDLMPAIDHWVIDRVFASLRRLKDCGQNLADWRFAINLCGPSLSNPRLLDAIAESVRQLDLPAGQISFEITETAAVSNLSDAVEFIQKLKALGCEIALDDFGSGLSSFAYLKNLPVDFLKIDGAFVKDLLDDPIDAAMVEAINQIGHVMDIRTIAEFVENEGIRDRLREIGVDFAQGYGIERPRLLDELLDEACGQQA